MVRSFIGISPASIHAKVRDVALGTCKMNRPTMFCICSSSLTVVLDSTMASVQYRIPGMVQCIHNFLAIRALSSPLLVKFIIDMA